MSFPALTRLDGTPLPADVLDGHVVLFVNVASQCGNTPQYAGLEKLWKSNRDRGLVVVGVPCNQFGAQEPGSSAEIAEFCSMNYGVDFPLLDKQDVNGAGRSALYKQLVASEAGGGADVRWNFEKFLVGRDGKVQRRFSARTQPDDAALLAAVDAALAPDMKAVLLGWAGTTVDFGSFARVEAFVEVFRRRDVRVTAAQARRGMGTSAGEHLRQMCADADVALSWFDARGEAPGPGDLEAMVDEALSVEIATVTRHARPIIGAVEVVRTLRSRGLRVGSTSPTSRAALDAWMAAAERHGFGTDIAISADEVPEGRPAPYLNWTAAMQLGVWPASACAVVGDTPAEVEAARAAGMWAIGVALSGNETGRTEVDVAAASTAQLEAWRVPATKRLRDAGAHAVIDTIADLLPALGDLDARHVAGTRP